MAQVSCETHNHKYVVNRKDFCLYGYFHFFFSYHILSRNTKFNFMKKKTEPISLSCLLKMELHQHCSGQEVLKFKLYMYHIIHL